MTDLEKRIKDAAQAYYGIGKSSATDEEFDQMVEELKKESPDSPLLTQVGWGYKVQQDSTPGNKVPHLYNFEGSLSKTYNWADIRSEFKTSKWLDASPKLDGLSVILYYTQGKLTLALTRGDGTVGIDITDKVRYILPRSSVSEVEFTGAVRGEIIMMNSDFVEYKKFHPEAKNSRNSAAGLINGKEITEDFTHLSLVVYSVIAVDGYAKSNRWSVYTQWLYEEFEEVVPRAQVFLNEKNIASMCQDLKECWEVRYPIDGIVLTDPDVGMNGSELSLIQQAYKFPAERKTARVLDVEWNMSKSRYAIPKLVVYPIELDGVTVTAATGYNAEYIVDNQIGKGAKVIIERRGQVVPNVQAIVSISNNMNVPTHCPECGAELVWEGVHLKCNNVNCSNASIQDLIQWLDNISPVDGLGDALRIEFLQKAYKGDPTIDSLMTERYPYIMMPKKGHPGLMAKMFESLYSTRPIPLTTALMALNIPRFGSKTCEKLSMCPDIVKELIRGTSMSVETSSILRKAIGNANTVSLQTNLDKVSRLRHIENRIQWEPAKAAETKGQVAITGTLSIARSKFEDMLKSAGYTVGGIKKTTLCLITNNPYSSSSKNSEADKHGVPKLTEEEFRFKYL